MDLHLAQSWDLIRERCSYFCGQIITWSKLIRAKERWSENDDFSVCSSSFFQRVILRQIAMQQQVAEFWPMYLGQHPSLS